MRHVIMVEDNKYLLIIIGMGISLLLFSGMVVFWVFSSRETNTPQDRPITVEIKDDKVQITKNNIEDEEEAFIGFMGPEGICQCPKDAPWVCGEDFLNYTSECEADCNNIKVLYQGECKIYEPDQPLPPNCNECQIECLKNELLYLGADGCPVCRCLPGFETPDTENIDEQPE